MIPTIAVLAGFALMLLFPCMVAMGIGRKIEEDEAAAAEEAEVHPWWTGATHTATWSAAQDVTDSRTHRVDAQMHWPTAESVKIAELRAQAARARVESETLAAIAREAAAKAEAAAFNARVAEEAAADVMESKQTRRAA